MKRSQIAALLSFICVGLGQFYNREFKKGWLLVLVVLVSILLFAIGGMLIIYGLIEAKKAEVYSGVFLNVLGLFSLIIFGFLSILDAYTSAKK